jgi:HSP20 family protein
MTTTLTRWRDSVVAPFETTLGLFPFVTPEIRIETVLEAGGYVVRAEIPGVDPHQDVTVIVADGILRIAAVRTAEKHDHARSEFHYGKLERVVALPAGAQEETAVAQYAHGILEITFVMGEPKEPGHRIAIEVAKETNTKAKR